MDISRREVLSFIVVGGSTGLAGCGTLSGDSATPESTPTGEDTPSLTPTSQRTQTSTPEETSTASQTSTPIEGSKAAPAVGCSDDYHAYDPHWVVLGPGPLDGFVLDLEHDEIAHGDTLVARVRNETDEERRTGNRMKYDIQYESDAGWRTIFAMEELAPWTDEGIGHPPGAGLTYELPFTRDGVVIEESTNPDYHVCSEITKGTYRFVYWGITPEREADEGHSTDYALGETFMVV